MRTEKIKFNLVCLFFIIGIFLFFNLALISAVSNNTQEDARICLNESALIVLSLEADNFSVERVNDTLNEADLIYKSQIIVSYGRKTDFSRVIEYCDEIKSINEQAYIARDEFSALLRFYNLSITSDMNTSSLDKSIAEIENEIKSERYENVNSLVNNAYDEISLVQSEYSAVNVIYRNTTRNLRIFVEKNWLTLVVLIGLVLFLFFAYKTKLRKWYIERKISALELRKKTIKELITNIQRGYFHIGNVSETEYNIRTKKFAELIRDIDRQIPLLYEQLAKTQSKVEDKFKKSDEPSSSVKIVNTKEKGKSPEKTKNKEIVKKVREFRKTRKTKKSKK